MPLIFKYFWFIGAAFMLMNVAVWRYRLEAVVSRGTATKAEIDRFTIWLAAWLAGGPILLGIVGILAGWSSPFCAGILMFDSIPKTLVSVVMLTEWAALLWWIWLGSGADFLARVGPALRQYPSYDKQYSPRLVRIILTALILVSAVGAAIVWRNVPSDLALVCPASTTGH